jgi:hypothetical protein
MAHVSDHVRIRAVLDDIVPVILRNQIITGPSP